MLISITCSLAHASEMMSNRMSLAEGEEGAFRGARLPASYGND